MTRLTQRSKYGFRGVCPQCRRSVVGGFQDVVRSVKTPTKLDIFCPHCKDYFALTKDEIDNAKKALADQMKSW